MAQVFEPHRAIFVVASHPHPKNTEYRVAWGYEKWEKPEPVTKVQMVYNGKVAGRISPSYPDNTLDEQAVDFAKKLLKKDVGTSSNKSKIVLMLKNIEEINKIEEIISQIENEILDMHLDMFNASAVSPAVSVNFKEHIELEDSLYAFIYKVEISR